MATKRVLITGSSGLIGSQAVLLFDGLGYEIHGIDNNARKHYFGRDGDTAWNLDRLEEQTKFFTHHDLDIGEASAIDRIVSELRPDHLIHCAAQPAHEYSREHPVVDFHVNVEGTVNLLEACRRHRPDATFIFCSSSKVYGPVNDLPYVELEARFDFPPHCRNCVACGNPALPGWSYEGLRERFPLEPGDGRGVYGTGKAAADLLVQEYGLSYGMPTVCLRGNCMTGSAHSPAQLHGFLAYLARCVTEGRTYSILGYEGKQVRDNIHAADFVAAIQMLCSSPPKPGTVYNLGGGRENSVSVLEAIDILESIAGKKLNAQYVEEPRHGDHRIYISDMTKFRKDYPDWELQWSLQDICADLIRGFRTQSRLLRIA